ncbi:MAG: LacI family DNA-binding transcriptional regulator [Salinibacterium sp.]|nr:LacI family DNA-binding transcriptional regulator [Salinibacterium sp.]
MSAATRAHILETGRSLDYTPNRLAAMLAGRGGDTIGIFLQDLHNDLFADVYDGIRAIADADGKHLVLAVGTLDGSGDLPALDTLEQSRVDVIIAAGLQLDDEEARRIAARIPLVSVARSITGIDSVTSNDHEGAVIATKYLIELGHRSIVFLSNPQTDGYRDRLRGYGDAMRWSALAPRVVGTTYSRGRAALDAGTVLDSAAPPSAFYAHNDQAALGVLDALAMRGLVPGRDVSVVGHDNSSISRAPGTALTTMDIHGASLGRTAAIMAGQRLNEPGAALLAHTSEPSLVIRSTTGINPGAISGI